jgi:ABC-type branched-subunit amino acid transport system permease subunit
LPASLNLLVGYAGLPSLGHAAYLGVAAYLSAWLYLKLGIAHWMAAPIALAATTLMAALFGLIALRATGLGFLMLTLALSQVLWGTAYRWVSVTEGDNGLRGLTRPAPFGVSLDDPTAVLFFCARRHRCSVMAHRTIRRIAIRCRAQRHARSTAAHECAWTSRVARALDYICLRRILGRGIGPAVRLLP